MTKLRNESDVDIQVKATSVLKRLLQDSFFTGVADTDTCKFDVAVLGYVVQSACGCRMCRKDQQMDCQHLQQRDCICSISFCTLELLQRYVRRPIRFIPSNNQYQWTA